MAAGTVSTADAREESLERTLGITEYQLRQALARLPQNARYLLSRYYAVGFEQKSREQLMSEMGLSSREFQKLHDESIAKLRLGEVGSGQPR